MPISFSYLMIIGPGEADQNVAQALSALGGIAQSGDEVVIVRNGYENELPEMEFSCPIVTFQADEKRSPAYARNAGTTRCTRDVVVFCDADDVSLTNRRELMEQAFEHQGADIAYTSMDVIDEMGLVLGVRNAIPGALTESDFVVRCPVFLPAAAIRRPILERFGFDESLRYAEDYYLWSQAFFEAGARIIGIGESAIRYRIITHKLRRKNSLSRLRCDYMVRTYVYKNSTSLRSRIVCIGALASLSVVRLLPPYLSGILFRRMMRA